MYQAGQQVMYGIHGVCRIVDTEERLVDRKRVTYLVLEPTGQEGSRYLVPTHNAAAMAKLKTILSRQELEALLQSPEAKEDGWITDENHRKQAYREMIGSGDRVRLLRMVSSLYRHKAAQAAAGRKCHISDDNFLRDAEKLLTSEISVVMAMDGDQARKYLREQLGQG